MRCACTDEPSCARGDWDKSAFLEISDVSHSDFEWIDPPTEAEVTLDHRLSRDAGQCLLTIYNHDLEEVTVVSPHGGVLNAGAGAHSVAVVFEDTGGRVGRYRFVISALETSQDGELNRDRQPKPALQKGANYTSPFSANFGMNGEFGDLGNYGQYAQDHVEVARQAQRSRGFGPWEDSEKQVPADAVGINADHVRRAVSEVKVFSFYGHGIVYPNDPANDGNAIVTRQVGWPARDSALATTAAVAEGLSDDYVAYGLVDAPEWTASSYSGTRIVCIFACRSYKNANSIAAFLRNTVGVGHAVGFSRTMHSLLGKVYGEEFWTQFQQYQ